MTDQSVDEAGVLPPVRRKIVFAGMIVAIGSVVMDNVAVTLALPSIAEHYGIDPARSIWLVSIYQIMLVSCLLPLTALAEKIGYSRVYTVGLAAFAVTAVMSTLAPDFRFLAMSRAAQGVAASAVMSVNLALIRTIFPERRLGGALGINATAGAIATSAGPMVAGFLIEYASWQWIFAIGVPTTALAAVVTRIALPASPVRAIRYDLGSAVLSALTFGGLLWGISSLGQSGQFALAALGLGLGTVSGVVLVARLRNVAEPLVPLDLLRIPPFAFSVGASVCAFSAQMLAFIGLPFLMQGKFGLSVVEAGLVFGFWPIAHAMTAAASGVLADRVSQGVLSAMGLAVLGAGLVLAVVAPNDATPADLAWRLAACGLGFALFQTPNNRILLGASPRWRAGAASGAIGTTRLLGQALGAALAALVLSRGAAGPEGLALWLAGGFAFFGAVISLLRYRDQRR